MSRPAFHAILDAAPLSASGQTCLDRANFRLGRQTEQLWEATRESLAGEPHSHASLNLHRDLRWFPASPGSVRRSFAEHVVGLAEAIQIRGIEMTFHPTESWTAEDFRWLTLRVPVDLLAAAAAARERLTPPVDRPTLTPPPLLRLLREQGIVESHLHIGSSMHFEWLWTGLMGGLPALVKERMRGGSLVGFSVPMLDNGTRGRRTASLLFKACALREAISHALVTGRRPEEWAAGTPVSRWPFVVAADDLPSPGEAAAVWGRWLSRVRRSAVAPKNLGELRAADPLASSWSGVGCLPETALTAAALRNMLDRPDHVVAPLFWEYQRIRCALFSFLVEPPGAPGLDRFTAYYHRISPFRGSLDHVGAETAWLQAGGLEGLARAVEVRTSPSADAGENRAFLDAVAASFRGCAAPEARLAVVFHMTKDKSRDGTRPFAWSWYRRTVPRALGFAKVLAVWPHLLGVLRGIDVASRELDVPTWPLVPLVARVRKAAERASARSGFEPLRGTWHAGEDVRTPIDGLRRIDELMSSGILLPGDRIGHGLALGARLDELQTVQPRGERMWDISWLLENAVRFDLQGTRLHALEDEMQEHGAADGMPTWITRDPRRAISLVRHDLLRADWPSRITSRGGQPLEGTEAWVLDRALDDRLEEPVVVGCPPTAVELATIQDAVRRRLALRSVCVEINPSSNLVVGDLGSLLRHPGFSLCPVPGAATDGRPTLPISINSDNPLITASSLVEEYAWIYHALCQQTDSRHAIDDFLAALARNGRSYHFATHPAVAQRGRVRGS